MGLSRSIPKVSLASVALASALVAPALDAGSAVDPACEVRSSIIESGDRYTGNTACQTYRPNVARTFLTTPHSKSMAAIYIKLIGDLLVHLQ
jgi:hypothetical protein